MTATYGANWDHPGRPSVRIIAPSVTDRYQPVIPIIRRFSPLVGKNQCRAFTLVELMIVLALLAIVASFAIPNFQEFIRRNQVSTQINEIVTDLNFTRSEAVKRNHGVTMCSSNDGASCTGTDWADGWIIVDAFDPDSVVRVSGGLSGNTTVTASGINPYQITYTAAGSNNGSISSIVICDDTKTFGRKLSFTVTGLPTVSEATCS